MESKKRIVTVDMKQELFDELEKYSKLVERSKGSIIRLAVKEYIKNKKPE